MKWLRLYSEARTDAKLRSLRDSEHRVWFDLLCLAADQEERGTIAGYSPALLALEVARGKEALLEQTLDKLVSLNIVYRTDNTITFVHFADRQYTHPSDRPERVAKRVQKHRKRARNEHVTGVTGVTTPEQNREEQIRSEAAPPARKPAASSSLKECRARFFAEGSVGQKVGALVDAATANGVTLTSQQKARLGALIKKHGSGRRTYEAFVSSLGEEGPVDYLTKVLEAQHGREGTGYGGRGSGTGRTGEGTGRESTAASPLVLATDDEIREDVAAQARAHAGEAAGH